MKKIIILTMFFVAVTGAFVVHLPAGEVSFTLEDRDRFIRLETKIDIGFQQIDKRFEELRDDMNKRFEQVDKRFEQVDKRFEELREDMNKRFEQVIAFLWMLTGIFTALTLGVIGFAYWDRRTIIKKAKEETTAEIEKEGRLKDLINALREVAKGNGELAKVLRQFHIL